MKRILFISEAKAVGGAEVYLERLALNLKHFKPMVAVPERLDRWAHQLKKHNLEVVSYPPGLKGLWDLNRMAGEADLVHINLPSTYDGGAGMLPWMLHYSAPIVVTEHLTRLPRSRRRDCTKGLTAHAVQTVICVSAASAEPLWGPRVVVIPNAVPDPGSPGPLPEGPLCVGVLSTHEERKRLDVLIDAMAFVPDAHLNLAGDGPLRGELEARVQASPAASRIKFHGHVEDPYAFLKDQHILALSSKLEAMPLSLLEALAAGRGILCRKFPGIEEIVTPHCGHLIDSDDPEVWGRVLGRLDLPAIRDLSIAARLRYEDVFTLGRWIEQTEAVYFQVLEGRE